MGHHEQYRRYGDGIIAEKFRVTTLVTEEEISAAMKGRRFEDDPRPLQDPRR